LVEGTYQLVIFLERAIVGAVSIFIVFVVTRVAFGLKPKVLGNERRHRVVGHAWGKAVDHVENALQGAGGFLILGQNLRQGLERLGHAGDGGAHAAPPFVSSSTRGTSAAAASGATRDDGRAPAGARGELSLAFRITALAPE
jgi:hypothetical protein